MWPAFLCGAHFILHAAGWAEGALAMSYEKFVIDADQCGAFHTFAEGMPIDDNALAPSMPSARSGPASISWARPTPCAITRRPSTSSTLSDNNSFEQWSEEGSQDIVQRANKAWKAHARRLCRPRHRRGHARGARGFRREGGSPRCRTPGTDARASGRQGVRASALRLGERRRALDQQDRDAAVDRQRRVVGDQGLGIGLADDDGEAVVRDAAGGEGLAHGQGARGRQAPMRGVVAVAVARPRRRSRRYGR